MSLTGLIKFRITLNEKEDTVTFEDITGSGYDGYSSVKGAIWITRNGILVYKNEDYDESQINEPDITLSVTEKEIEYEVLKGEYEVNYRVVAIINGVTEDLVTTKSYNFQSEAPEITMSKTIEYYLSKLTLTDSSTYIIDTSSTAQAEAASVIRHLIIRPPLGIPEDSGLDYDNEDAPDVVTVGPSLYTQNYDVKLTTTLTYNLQAWGNEWWFVYVTEVEYNDNFDIEYEEACITSCLSCIRQLESKMIAARNKSPRDADYYERLIYDISFYYDLYLMYKSADMDPTYACDKIKAILGTECAVSTTPSKTPVKITPVVLFGQNGEDGADGSTWYSGTNKPYNNEGNNGDFYLRTSDGTVYKKTGGTWQQIMKMAIVGNRTIRTIGNNQSPTYYFITSLDDILYVNAISSAITLYLPNATSAMQGREFVIKAKTLTRGISILPYSGPSPDNPAQINGSSSYQFKTQGDSLQLVLNSTNWEIH